MRRLDHIKDRKLIDDALEELEKKESPYYKAERLAELRKIEVPKLIDDSRGHSYYEEAEINYVQGCFRSCIFSCAIVIEFLFKHVLIYDSEDPEEAQWRIIIEKWTFGKIIEESKKHPKLKVFVDDAQWLNDLRNKVAAHPLYIGTSLKKYFYGENTYKLILFNKNMTREINELLTLLDKDSRDHWMNSEITSEISDKSGKKEIIKEKLMNLLLGDPLNIHYRRVLYWAVIGDYILQDLAYEAYKRMAKMLISLNEYISP